MERPFIQQAWRLESVLEIALDPADPRLSEELLVLYGRLQFQLLADVGTPGRWRARLLRRELFRLQPTFPMDDLGRPLEEPVDEALWVEDRLLWDPDLDFAADGAAAAATHVRGRFESLIVDRLAEEGRHG